MLKPTKIYSIQLLRALAALLVVVDHAMTRRNVSLTDSKQVFWQLGAFGVSIFFVISGFVMVYTAFDLPVSLSGAGSFVERRVKRIAPLYWIATALAAIVVSVHGLRPSIAELGFSLSFVAHPSDRAGGLLKPILGQGWTLNYEAFFYFIFACTIALPRKWTVLAILGTLASLIIVGFDSKSIFDTSEASNMFQFYTDPILLLFGVGSVLGLCRRQLKRLYTSIELNAIVFFASLSVLFLTYVSIGSPPTADLAFRSLVQALATLCVIFAILEKETAARSFLLRSVEHFGDASYSVYLFHPFAFTLFGRPLDLIYPGAPPVFKATFLIIGACGIGSLVHVYVETPLLRLLSPLRIFDIGRRNKTSSLSINASPESSSDRPN